MCKKLTSLLCVGLGVVVLTSTAARAFNYDLRIANGNDDVEEYVSGHSMYLDSSDLEIPYENDGNPPSSEQIIGLRWEVPVPKGSEILKAYLEIECDETKGGTNPVNVIIQGQLTPNASAFTDATADVSSRPPTKAQVKWSIANWTAENDKAQSPDISAIIQEIIDQSGWVGGNALVLTIQDDKEDPSTGVRCAEAYEGEATAAVLLHIEVFNPAANTPSPADGEVGVFIPLLSWSKGDGGLFHDVYLGKTPELTEADLVSSHVPVAMYYHVAGLEPGVMYYWRVDETDIAGNVTTGPVWSFVTQAETAYYPTPIDGSTDVALAPVLTWYPGQAVVKHHVYLGNDPDAVMQGAADTDKGEQEETSFTATDLDSVATYYWRVDEIGFEGEVKTGPVWSFTTCLPVDDFESYTDDEGSRIYETWIDGWVNNTGSVVGNLTAPFAEQTIVQSGLQSMPMDYNNVNSPYYSEAELDFSPTQDWTANGLADLRLAFRGTATNSSDPLYVAVEDSSGASAVVTYSDAAAATTTTWTEWKIPLSDFAGVNLAKVKALYIGLGDRSNPVVGGAGRIFIDGIRVTKP